jgi:hypothetical protein
MGWDWAAQNVVIEGSIRWYGFVPLNLRVFDARGLCVETSSGLEYGMHVAQAQIP